jgi:hypothetical protein
MEGYRGWLPMYCDDWAAFQLDSVLERCVALDLPTGPNPWLAAKGYPYHRASSRVYCIGRFDALAIWHLFELSEETPAEGNGDLCR